MTGPSLAKHENDLKLLETMLTDVRNLTIQKETEYHAQIIDLNTQMTAMGRQVNSLADELKTDRQDLTNQIRELVDVVKLQTKGTSLTPPSGVRHTVSSANIHMISPGSAQGHGLHFGNTLNSPPQNTNTTTTPVIVHSSPFLIPQPPFTPHAFTHPPPISTGHTSSLLKLPTSIPIADRNQQPTFNLILPFQQYQTHIPNYPNYTHGPVTGPYTQTTHNYQGLAPPSTDLHVARTSLNTPYKLSKVEFPKFDGSNARGWILKAGKFFNLNPSMDTLTKVVFASLYLEGEVDYWFQTVTQE